MGCGDLQHSFCMGRRCTNCYFPEIHDIKSLYQLSYSDLDEVFKLAQEDLMSRLYPQFTAEQRNSRPINDMNYVTVYDRLISYNM